MRQNNSRTPHPFNLPSPRRFWTFRQPVPNPLRQIDGDGNAAEESPAEPETKTVSDSLLPLPRLEAALFLAKEPIPGRRLIQLAGLADKTKIKPLIRQLNEQYRRDQSAFFAAEVAEGFQLRTRPELAAWLARISEIPASVRLSNPAMETLTVIAYRQPVLRADVERIRGVQCGELIRQLLDQNLIKIVGRSEDLGRPFLYGTTKKFLHVFGLANLGDLPELP